LRKKKRLKNYDFLKIRKFGEYADEWLGIICFLE
jgi:hypothetical protein